MVLTTFAILVVQAIGGIILARELGPADRGLLAALVLWATLSSDIGSAGTPAGVSYWAASGSASSGLRYLRSGLPAMGVVAIASYTAIIAISGRSDELPMLAIVAMAAWIIGRLAYLPLQRLQQGLGNMSAFNGIRAISEMGSTLGYAAFAVAGLLTVSTGAVSIAAMLFVAGAIALLAMRRRLPPQRRTPESGDRQSFWSYSARSWLQLLATRSNATVDLLVVSLLAATATDIGLYAVAAASTAVISALGGSLGLDLFPQVAGLESGDDPRGLLRRYLIVNVTFSTAAAGAFFIIADWLIPLVYGEAFRGAVGPARILLIGAVASSLAIAAGQGLSGMGRPGQVALAQLAGASVTVIGATVAISRSLEAVAVAATVGYVITAGLVMWFLHSAATEAAAAADG